MGVGGGSAVGEGQGGSGRWGKGGDAVAGGPALAAAGPAPGGRAGRVQSPRWGPALPPSPARRSLGTQRGLCLMVGSGC